MRKLALEGHRFTPQEALEEGIIDAIAVGSTSESVINAARQIALQRAENAKSGVWGLIKVLIHIYIILTNRLLTACILQKTIYLQAFKEISKDYRTVQAVHEDYSSRARL